MGRITGWGNYRIPKCRPHAQVHGEMNVHCSGANGGQEAALQHTMQVTAISWLTDQQGVSCRSRIQTSGIAERLLTHDDRQAQLGHGGKIHNTGPLRARAMETENLQICCQSLRNRRERLVRVVLMGGWPACFTSCRWAASAADAVAAHRWGPPGEAAQADAEAAAAGAWRWKRWEVPRLELAHSHSPSPLKARLRMLASVSPRFNLHQATTNSRKARDPSWMPRPCPSHAQLFGSVSPVWPDAFSHVQVCSPVVSPAWG